VTIGSLGFSSHYITARLIPQIRPRNPLDSLVLFGPAVDLFWIHDFWQSSVQRLPYTSVDRVLGEVVHLVGLLGQVEELRLEANSGAIMR